MIVADSSVWIDHFNGRVTPQTVFLRALLRERSTQARLIVGDLIVCEVLQGARSNEEARTIETSLRRLSPVSMLNPKLAVSAAAHYRALRIGGITVRSTIDVIISAFCIAGKHRLLHADGDFEHARKYLGLKVVQTAWSVNESAPDYTDAA